MNQDFEDLKDPRYKKTESGIPVRRDTVTTGREYPQVPLLDGKEAKVFSSGAFRSASLDKVDYDGTLSPLALEAFTRYLLWCSYLDNGDRRPSDNWQLGMDPVGYRKSLWRHMVDLWRILRGYKPLTPETNIVWAAAASWFNIQGILHEAIKADPDLIDKCEAQATEARNKRWAAAKSEKGEKK